MDLREDFPLQKPIVKNVTQGSDYVDLHIQLPIIKQSEDIEEALGCKVDKIDDVIPPYISNCTSAHGAVADWDLHHPDYNISDPYGLIIQVDDMNWHAYPGTWAFMEIVEDEFRYNQEDATDGYMDLHIRKKTSQEAGL